MDSADTEPQQDAPEQHAPAAPRWFQRVLPVTAIAVGLVALATLVVPAFRDQVELSVSRRPQPYVELYFARTPSPATAQAVCTRRGSSVRVQFVVASHLQREQTVAWRIAVAPDAKGARVQHRAGSVRTSPATSTEVRKAFTVPRRKGYTVSVRLPALDQQLRARCPGRHS